MSVEGQAVESGVVEFQPEGEVPPRTVDGFAILLEESDFHPVARARPVDSAERVDSVDVIRGVALMGILAMNIVGFGWPGDVYSNPTSAPDHDRADVWLWAFNHLAFDTKMMTLFSMLFGAGLVLMADRADGRGAKLGWTYYRRVFWLLMIGLVHSYLIWDGDILVSYASCGLLLYPVRRWSGRTLIVVGCCLNLLMVPLWLGFARGVAPFMQATAESVEARTKVGEKPKAWETKVADAWKKMAKSEPPKREDFLEEIRTYRGGYWGIVKDRANHLIWGQTVGFLVMEWWFLGGRMLIGMGLMKLGVFAAARSNRAYVLMMALGYGVGLPLMAFDAVHQVRENFYAGRDVWEIIGGWPMINTYGSLPVVFGHIGLVMLLCKTRSIPWLTRRLGAAGRMALSCYLFDSIFCTTLFYGYGFDLTATLHRPMLYAIVLAIWTAQLLACPLWLEVFRFGPAEWLWRSLTYGKPQPMRRRPAVGLAALAA